MKTDINIGLEIAEDLLTLCKTMFKAYTGQEIATAKQLIAIEERLASLKGRSSPVKETSKPIPVVKEVVKTLLTDDEKKAISKGKLPVNKDFDNQPKEAIPEKPQTEKFKPF
jgi:hypothetical protein